MDLGDLKLPPFLGFKTTQDLVRIGRDYDGGYLVSRADVALADCLVGLGLNDDWSFEASFRKSSNVEIYAFDASVGGRYFLSAALNGLFCPSARGGVWRLWRTWWRYLSFFSKVGVNHIEKHVGTAPVHGRVPHRDYIALARVLDDLPHHKIFLKIDIEGDEYGLLDELVSRAGRLSGCVIEFHECHKNLAAIESFVKAFELSIVHVHANNHSPICSDLKIPHVMEISFSRYGDASWSPIFPHPLDMPNNKRLPDIILSL
jgi:hypothetical protein